MDAPFIPASESELASVLTDASARGTPLAVVGGGTRSTLGRPMQTAATLGTTGLSGVTLYEPSELVLSARAGTPLAEIETLLASENQHLPFEPMDHRRLLGSEGEATIGGVVAANVSGPRRIQAGAARDSLIGIRAATGGGEIVKSGGRVMKNVTGYDVARFLAGSFGTLAVLTEVTFKVLPAPEAEVTLALSGLDDTSAVAAMSAALGSPYAVTGAAHCPARHDQSPRTVIRLEGFSASVADRADRLARELQEFGTAEKLDNDASTVLWRAIRDVEPIAASASPSAWRISVKQTDGPKLVEAVRRSMACDVLYDWGGGLVWLAGEDADVGAATIREAVRSFGGHATLICAPDDVRQAIEVFQPLDPPLMTLTRKFKQSFDPAGILNPGRMYAGL